METFIIAPHPDDEIIGCFEVLLKTRNQSVVINYTSETTEERKNETKKLRKYYPNIHQYFGMDSLESSIRLDSCKSNLYYFPDPIYEIHFEHRRMGALGETLLRDGYNVIFYSTSMNAPYLHEVIDSTQKEILLNNVYPSQKSLWEYEKKYILFEGRNQWIMK